MYFRSGCDQYDLRITHRVRQNVGAFCEFNSFRIYLLIDYGYLLASESDAGWSGQLHHALPRLDGLVRIRWADHLEVRHRAERQQMFDRFVSRAVLAEPHTIVRPDKFGGH